MTVADSGFTLIDLPRRAARPRSGNLMTVPIAQSPRPVGGPFRDTD